MLTSLQQIELIQSLCEDLVRDCDVTVKEVRPAILRLRGSQSFQILANNQAPVPAQTPRSVNLHVVDKDHGSLVAKERLAQVDNIRLAFTCALDTPNEEKDLQLMLGGHAVRLESSLVFPYPILSNVVISYKISDAYTWFLRPVLFGVTCEPTPRYSIRWKVSNGDVARVNWEATSTLDMLTKLREYTAIR